MERYYGKERNEQKNQPQRVRAAVREAILTAGSTFSKLMLNTHQK
jgi:hypothetical protein